MNDVYYKYNVLVDQNGEDGLTDTIYESLGRVIRDRRELLGLSQSALAKHTGMARTTVTTIESGGQNLLLHQFVELAQALRISPVELMGSAGDLAPSKPEKSNSPQVENLLMKLTTSVRANRA